MKKTGRILAAIVIIALIVIIGWFVYDTLRVKSVPEKLAEIAHLEDERYHSRELTSYLVDDSAVVRSRAAMAIGRIGSSQAADQLLDALRDESIDVARSAAFALGLTGDAKLAPQLVDIAMEVPSPVTARLVDAAGRLADSTQTGVAADLLGMLTHPSPDVREAACYALFRASAKRQAEELIPFIAKETDSLARLAALYSLARLQIAKALPVFIEYQADSDPYTRTLAVRGLASVKTDEAARLLALSLNDSDQRVVAQAIAGLRSVGTVSAANYLAGKLSKTTDENLIVAILDALRALDGKGGVPAAQMHVHSELSPNLTAAAVRYLAAVQGDQTVGMIDSLLTTTPPATVRAACADAYGEIGKPGIVSRLAVLFADEDPLVRASAFSQLVELDSANVSFYVQKGLADRDFMPVVLAIDQVGQRQMLTFLPDLLRFMLSGPDVDPDVRRSAVAAAGSLFDKAREDQTSDSLLMGILVTGILDPEYVVRREAAGVYKDKLSENRDDDITPASTRISKGQIEDALETAAVAGNPSALIITEKGEIEIELYVDLAPLTVLNFMDLARDNFYNGLVFHRVVPNFVAQGGDPRGDGWGGPPWFIRCEYSPEPFVRGTVGIATSGKDTGGSQFFITHSPQPHLDGRYTVFGQVVNGMDVVDRLVPGDVIEQILIQEGQS